MQAGRLIADLAGRFDSAGIDSAVTDARLLVAAALNVEPMRLRMKPETDINAEIYQKIMTYAERRLKREPVSKILKTRGFWRLMFKVTGDVLDPRPDSETLVEEVLSLFPEKKAALRILDLGTGSGCLALSLLSEYPKASAVGLDASDAALAVAVENAEMNGLSQRFTVKKADWTQEGWTEDLLPPYDLIISNPPYIAENECADLPPEVREYDPPAALFAGIDGLDAYRIIGRRLKRLLKPKGYAVFEFGRGQEGDVREILCREGMKFISYRKDLGNIIRCLSLVNEKKG